MFLGVGFVLFILPRIHGFWMVKNSVMENSSQYLLTISFLQFCLVSPPGIAVFSLYI